MLCFSRERLSEFFAGSEQFHGQMSPIVFDCRFSRCTLRTLGARRMANAAHQAIRRKHLGPVATGLVERMA